MYRLAPYTVLVDPERAKALLRPDADANLAFLFRKQIEEADMLCFSKSDLAMKFRRSARIGRGRSAAEAGRELPRGWMRFFRANRARDTNSRDRL